MDNKALKKSVKDLREGLVEPVEILRMMLNEIQLHSSDGLATLDVDYEVDQRLVDLQLSALERAVGKKGKYNRTVWTRIFHMNLQRSAWIQLTINDEDSPLLRNPGDYFGHYEIIDYNEMSTTLKGTLDSSNKEYLIKNCLTEQGDM